LSVGVSFFLRSAFGFFGTLCSCLGDVVTFMRATLGAEPRPMATAAAPDRAIEIVAAGSWGLVQPTLRDCAIDIASIAARNESRGLT
jgi:hypothetical protein